MEELDLIATQHYSPKKSKHPKVKLEINPALKVEFPIHSKPKHEVFTSKGRATKVFDMTSETQQTHLVAKSYWPNRERMHEEEIIDIARGVATDLPNHLPCVFGLCTFDSADTGRIRERLGIDSNHPHLPQTFHVIIYECLFPITERTGNDFVVAWLECIQCHYVLWKHHIRHQDLSLANLMVRFKDGWYYGAVNDWDLSFIVGKSKSCADLTATVPFMALDLACAPLNSNNRVYYHDLESFLWILIWVFLAVKDKKVVPTPQVADWQTSDPIASFRVRWSLFYDPEKFPAHSEWAKLWIIGKAIANWLLVRCRNIDREETPGKNRELLSNLCELVRERFEGEIEGRMPSVPRIDDL